MPTAAAIPTFLVSLAVTLLASRQLAGRLDRLGVRLGFPESLIGLLTAVAADGPEISSALVALAKGDHGVSVGVLVGSNAFNLAAMIGVSGLLVGAVWLAREALVLEGAVAACVTLLAAGVLLEWISVSLAAGLAALTAAVYLALVIGGYELLEHRAVPARVADWLSRALATRAVHRPSRASAGDPAHHLLALIVVDLSLIVAGSFGMVEAAVTLGHIWGISGGVLGVLILAPLTSIPNAFTGIRLGLARRGAALVAETFNSNTINLGAGVIVPALITPVAALTDRGKVELGWLVGMTLVCMAWLAVPSGLRRGGAAVLVALYLGFIALQLF
jgi:cation:H+ antiporter